mgnify:FL=1|tara:strand:- start:506 stop:709 length:204 start_codon:yes stop_codon:yes gene_type:complete
MKGKIADINELRDQSNMPDGDYALETVTVKEIMNKYPDKVVDVLDRERDIVVVMDTCKIIMRKTGGK